MRETVVLTASSGAFAGLAEALRDAPVAVVERPLVSFRPPADWGQLDAALARKSRYRSLALTSPRAAEAVVQRIRASSIDWDEGVSPTTWAVGAATAAALGAALGPVRRPDRPPALESSAGGVLAHAMLESRAGSPVLFPCGERHRNELPTRLREAGIEVDEVVCYRAVLASSQEAREALVDSSVVVVASPRVVELLADACPAATRPRLVAIGPTTAASAQAAGWLPVAVAEEPSTKALASAITGLLAPR